MYELDARSLHAAARDPESETPEVFQKANEAVEEARVVAQAWTAARHRLIYEARQIGVPYPALSRWTGMHVSTLAVIAASEPPVLEEEEGTEEEAAPTSDVLPQPEEAA